MKINLDDLEAQYRELKPDLFVVAGDLVTVGDMLALIRVARAAEQIYNLLPWDFGHCTSVKELEEALKEISP